VEKETSPESFSGTVRNLDVMGMLCPLPIRLTDREMADLRSGDRLVVRGDDPALRIDLVAWCARRGHRLVELVEREGSIHAVVEKRSA